MAKKKHRTLAELERAGLKIRGHMKEDEAIDWCKIGVAAGELDCIADKYRKMGWNDWSSDLRTCVTKVNRILAERLNMMNEKAVRALINRRNHAKMVISIDYIKRIGITDTSKDLVTVTADDYQDVLEMAFIQTCEGCLRPDYNQCKYYDIYTKLAVPVFTDDGEQCPYQYNVLMVEDAKKMGVNNVLVK